jgi:hypothetical protein
VFRDPLSDQTSEVERMEDEARDNLADHLEECAN